MYQLEMQKPRRFDEFMTMPDEKRKFWTWQGKSFMQEFLMNYQVVNDMLLLCYEWIKMLTKIHKDIFTSLKTEASSFVSAAAFFRSLQNSFILTGLYRV